MLTGINQQILTAYEELGMSINEIATEFDGIDIVAIKSILMSFSPKYRKDMTENKSLDFNDNELSEANSVILHLMRYSEDEHIRARLARYVRDDKKGRLDIAGIGRNGLNVNILMFNQRLAQARVAKERSKKELVETITPDKTIEIEAEKVEK